MIRKLVHNVPSNVPLDYVNSVTINVPRDLIYTYEEIPAEYDRLVSVLKMMGLLKFRLERRFAPTTFLIVTIPGNDISAIAVSHGANMPAELTDRIKLAIPQTLQNLAEEPNPKSWWVKPKSKEWKRIVRTFAAQTDQTQVVMGRDY
jgi:hypothetical protein